MTLRKCLQTLLLFAMSLLPLSSHAAPLRYKITVLPSNFLFPADINNAGQITGTAEVSPGIIRAAILSKGKIKDLGTLGGESSIPNAINEAGDVTGLSQVPDSDDHAFLFARGRMVDIGVDGPGFSNGWGINVKRQVVGVFSDYLKWSHAFLFSDSKLKDLGTLGGDFSMATDINDAATIVGESTISSDPDKQFVHAFVLRNGVMTDLGVLEKDGSSSAIEINNCGQIAGTATVGGVGHVFLYENGAMRDLGFFNGRYLSVMDMNEQGMIVGTAESSGAEIGYLYVNGKLHDLDTLVEPAGWDVQRAEGINDLGQIVGIACRNDDCKSVRFDPIYPIPMPRHCLPSTLNGAGGELPTTQQMP